MFKVFIAPVQRWLLSRSQCVGCGADLNLGKREKFKQGQEKVTCSCGRIFIYQPSEARYRRALIEEIK